MKQQTKRSIFTLLLVLLLLMSALTACGGRGDAGPPRPVVVDEVVYVHHFGIAVQRGNAVLRDQIWAALQVLAADGTVERIARAWFGFDPTLIPPDPNATEHLGEVRERTLIVGFDSGMAPKSYIDERGELVGFDIDLAQAVCDYFGWTLVLLPIEWADKEMELQSGNIDCLWGGVSLKGRVQTRMYHTPPYMENRQVVLTMSNAGINSLGRTRDRTIALRAGSAAETALEQNSRFQGRLGDIVILETLADCLIELERGRVDAVLMDETAAFYYIRTGDAAAFGGRNIRGIFE